MSTPTQHPQTVLARRRRFTRVVVLALLVAMIAGAIYFRELEFVTAALVTILAGVAVDVRQTKKLARARVEF